jgi:hypothetical protein
MISKTLFSSATVEWATPVKVFEELNKEFHFDFDPCPLGGDIDGRSSLFLSWRGRRVFCNPPYGPAISDFLRRADEAQIAVYLLPARTDTKWFHDLVLPRANEIRFLRSRLNFGDNADPLKRAPFPSMIVVFMK